MKFPLFQQSVQQTPADSAAVSHRLQFNRFRFPVLSFWAILSLCGVLFDYRPAFAQQDNSPKPKSSDDPAPANTEPPADEEQSLPKYADMEPPSMEDLLRQPPVDWIVLKTGEVIISEPVVPRPDTLEKMKARVAAINKEPRPVDREAVDDRNRRREEAQHIDIFLPGGGESPEFQLHMKHVEKIVYHQDLMLMRINVLLDEGKLRDAFELLFILIKRAPKWPHIEDMQNRLLFVEGKLQIKRNQPRAALVVLEELHDRKAKFPGLKEQLGIASDRLVTASVEQKDFRRARFFIERLRIREPKHQIVTKWRNNLQNRTNKMTRQALEASKAGKDDVAAFLIKKAARIWPMTRGLRDAHRRLTNRFQSLDVGVLRLPGEPTSYILPTESDQRYAQLTRSCLFEIDRSDDSAHYRTRYFEQWEPTDLGRQVDFTLRQTRASWESRPILTASSIVSNIASRLDSSNPLYDERLAYYVESLTIQSPFQFQIRFAHVPPRTEALFRFPVMTYRNDSQPPADSVPTIDIPETDIVSKRFYVHNRDDKKIQYRRTVPEPENSPLRHASQVMEIKYESHDLAIQGLLRGEVSVLPHIQPWEVSRLRSDDRFFVQQYALPVTHVVQFNPKTKALHSRELRRAFAYALDRPKILTETVLQSPVALQGRVVPRPFRSRGYIYNTLLKPREHNLTLALSLAIAAKHQLGGTLPTFKMICVPDPVALEAAKELITQWGRAGLQVELIPQVGDDDNAKPQPWDLVYRTVRMVEPAVEMWPFLTLEPHARVESLLHLPDWLRQELIELDNVGDRKSAIAILQRLERHLWVEAQFLPLWEVDDFMVIRKNIRGFQKGPSSTYHNIERWTIQSWYPTTVP